MSLVLLQMVTAEEGTVPLDVPGDGTRHAEKSHPTMEVNHSSCESQVQCASALHIRAPPGESSVHLSLGMRCCPPFFCHHVVKGRAAAWGIEGETKSMATAGSHGPVSKGGL